MKPAREIKKIAERCISIENQVIGQLIHRIDDNFVHIINVLLNTEGRIIIAAIGKSANIANKIVATFNSTGQPSVFLHAADAIHGDLGNIQEKDTVICISNSGNTPEIKALVPLIKGMNNTIIGMTGNLSSFLAKQSDFIIDVSVEKEACPNNLAPTSSTTAQLVIGDALAISLLECKNFTDKDFARFHPGGVLGKRLSVKMLDLLHEQCMPQVSLNDLINTVIIEISKKRVGATVVLDNGKIKGIITDGDLRRMLEEGNNIGNLVAKDIMNKEPKMVDVNMLAYDALKLMEKSNISQLIILDDEQYAGIVHIHDIIKEGIV